MILVTAQSKIYVAVEPADFRLGIDGLAMRCRTVLDSEPFAGALFVFRNRRATAVKALEFDGRGFWLHHRRLSSGRFRFWPGRGNAVLSTLEAHELVVLLQDGDPGSTKASPVWRPLPPRS